VLRLRHTQMLINEKYKAGAFRIPIHLAMGHEAIAVAVSAAMRPTDRLVLPHRNLHYNLARGATLRSVLDEFLLEETGLDGGALGSMNLRHEEGGVIYTSSILGNNFGVGVGVALARKLTEPSGLAIIVTGDGAMEEGAFHECMVTLCAQQLPAILLVETNGWAMATRIDERRAPIDLSQLAAGYGCAFAALSGNDVHAYAEKLAEIRATALAESRPCIVEVRLATLGDWQLFNDENPDGKYINYHAGPAPEVTASAWPVLREMDDDPVHVLGRRFDQATLSGLAETLFNDLSTEAA
jgi:TPP-dependent pyruvate/acetoin dehydrogenase alpha subunit